VLTKLTIRNFKQFEEVDIDLGDTVVLIGPNNSGKTSALQALSLWELGLRRWNERRGASAEIPKARAGIAINRRDLVSVPVPAASLLWRDRVYTKSRRQESEATTRRVRIDVLVEGITRGVAWRCGLEFDHEVSKPDRVLVVLWMPPVRRLVERQTRSRIWGQELGDRFPRE